MKIIITLSDGTEVAVEIGTGGARLEGLLGAVTTALLMADLGAGESLTIRRVS